MTPIRLPCTVSVTLTAQKPPPLSTEAIAEVYAGVLDGMVADDDAAIDLPLLQTDTLMRDAGDRRRVAAETLRFAAGLA